MSEDICGAETASTDGPCQHPAGSCPVPSHGDDDVEENPQGRTSKLTKERQEKIASAIEDGKSIESAARMAGVHPATVYAWVDKGEDQSESIYAEFHERFVRARGHGEDRYFETVFGLAREEGDLATLMSMLKQRYPDSWGEVDRGEQAGGLSVQSDVVEITEDSLTTDP